MVKIARFHNKDYTILYPGSSGSNGRCRRYGYYSSLQPKSYGENDGRGFYNNLNFYSAPQPKLYREYDDSDFNYRRTKYNYYSASKAYKLSI